MANTAIRTAEQLNAIDLISQRHCQVLAVLNSVILSFGDSKEIRHFDPSAAKDTVWAAMVLLEQAHAAVLVL